MAKREAVYEEPFKESMQWRSGNDSIRSNEDFFVHLGADSKHNRELSFEGNDAKERALLTARMYERLKEHGIIHPKTRFAVYAKGRNTALAIATPRLSEPADYGKARAVRDKLEAFRKKHDLPELTLDLTSAFEANYKNNFRSEKNKTYLIDPGLFTTFHLGKTPTIEQLRRIAGK